MIKSVSSFLLCTWRLKGRFYQLSLKIWNGISSGRANMRTWTSLPLTLCGSLSRRLHESPGQDRRKTGPGHSQFLWPCGFCPRRRVAETGNGMTEAVPFPEKTILLSYDPAVFRRGEKKGCNVSERVTWQRRLRSRPRPARQS